MSAHNESLSTALANSTPKKRKKLFLRHLLDDVEENTEGRTIDQQSTDCNSSADKQQTSGDNVHVDDGAICTDGNSVEEHSDGNISVGSIESISVEQRSTDGSTSVEITDEECGNMTSPRDMENEEALPVYDTIFYGVGERVYSDGSKYQGNFLNSARHG
jgi:hypothetical protein